MTEKIQMTEEQANELIEAISCGYSHDYMMKKLIQHGYIKKSAFEEAEDMYQTYITNPNRHLCDRTFLHKLIEILHDVIWEMKNEKNK